MISVIDHSIDSSLYLWLDNLLISKGHGYFNFTGRFIESTGKIQNYYTYAAPHRQFNYESGNGAIVMSGYYEGNQFKTGNIDYNHGAILFASKPTGTVSGVYSSKEVNLYFANDNVETLLFENKYQQNPKHAPSYTGYSALDKVYPAIFIETVANKEERLCFEDFFSTTVTARLTVLADSPYLFKSICRLIQDCKERHMPIFNPNQMPFTFLGNITGAFKYSDWAAIIQPNPQQVAFIKDVTVSKLDSRVNAEIGSNVFGGFINIDLDLYRHRMSL